MPKVKPEGQTAGEVKWHPYFRDPASDIILASTDGIHFRTSRFRLSEASSVFAGMFEVAKPTGTARLAEVVDIPSSSAALEALLELITALHPPQPKLGVEDAIQLRDMITLYDCANIGPQATAALDAAVKASPLAALRSASRANDVALARKAMSSINCRGSDPQTSLSSLAAMWDLIDQLLASWRLPLLRLLIEEDALSYGRGSVGGYGGRGLKVIDDWGRIAPRFSP